MDENTNQNQFTNPKSKNASLIYIAIFGGILFILFIISTGIFYIGKSVFGQGLVEEITSELTESNASNTNINNEVAQELLRLKAENAALRNQVQNTVTPTPTAKATPTPVAQKANCTTLKIYEGEFKSEKCYVAKDYQDLNYYLSRYDSAVFAYNSAASTANFTCDNGEFFEEQCENAEDRMDEAEDQMDEYKGIINGIIARGR